MGRCVVPLILVSLLLAASGCKTSGGLSNPFARVGSDASTSQKEPKPQIAEGNPFRRTGKRASAKTASAAAETSKIAESKSTEPEVRQASASQSSDAAGTSHDAETLQLIERELRDAAPEERKQLFADLKGLDPPLVRQILRMRRMVRQIGQGTGAELANAASASGPAAPGMPAGGEVAGVRHIAPPQPSGAPVATSAVPFAGLGGANPWGAPLAAPPAGIPAPTGAYLTHSPYDARAPQHAMPSAAQGGQVAYVATPGAASFGHSSYYVPNATGVVPTGTTAPVVPAPHAAPYPQPHAGPMAAATPVAGHSWGHGLPVIGPAVGTNAPPGPPLQPGDAVMPAVGTGPMPAQPVAAVPPASPLDPQTGLPLSAATGQYTPRPTAYSPKWNEDLQKLISIAEAEIGQASLTPESTDQEKRDYIEKHVYLRLLYLMSGQQERALQAIPGLSATDQEFWQQMFWAVANYFDVDAIPDSADRAAQTITQLRGAVQRLQENARLELRNVTFCHKIASYGNYERFERDEFSQGQPVLVYAEVSNFKSEPTTDGQYRTVLKSTIEIYKAGPNGGLVERMSFPATEDLCRNPRRDYFHSYEFTIPTAQKITLGPHVLKLTVEDELSRKVATYSLNFTVK